MEPIRPDDDELRATRARNPEPPKVKKSPQTPESTGRGGKKSPGALLMLLLVLVAGAGAAGWYQQNQRLAQMESQLEEADYWARQSKLALARFEGELSETGEDLQETGQGIAQTLSAQGKRLDKADSEIAKLWGVANDRNKARLNDQEARLKALDETLEAAAADRQALTAAVSGLESTLTTTLATQIAALETALEQDMATQDERLDRQQAALEKVQSAVAGVDGQIDSRLKRFEREQALTIDGLEGRLAALEKTTQSLSGGQIESIRTDLASLTRTVSAIDASRAQLTSRLVRLSEEVSQLRAKVGGQ